MTSPNQQQIQRHLSRRHRAEKRFIWYGRAAIAVALSMLVFLLASIVGPGISGFTRHEVILTFDTQTIHVARENPQKAAIDALQAYFPAIGDDRIARRKLALLLSPAAVDAVERTVPFPAVTWPPEAIGARSIIKRSASIRLLLPLADAADQYLKGKHVALSDEQKEWLNHLMKGGQIKAAFHATFFTDGDSREPELAGFAGSIAGSFFALTVCLSLSLTLGIATAIYLEEYAPKNRITHLIEVNINNLAAVPSIIFGLLGLAVFLNFFGMPRSSALVGGLTLALMTLPVIIISARVALRAVPPSIREAARGLGASPLQVVMHHVIPYALPGMMTGAILGMARAIGETAPLLMIGMVAFIADVPDGWLDPATAMPVQIYIWASSPETGFLEKTSTGIIVLLMLLALMNATAIYLRRKFEIKW